MTVCRATKRDGRPCTLSATDSNGYCWAHSPRHAAKRKEIAAKGGRSRAGGELVAVKAEIREVIEAVRSKALERSTGAVVFQGYNTLLKALDTERRIRESEELEKRLAALEEALQPHRGGSRWGG